MNKNRMAGWQFAVVEAMLGLLLLSMFLPFISITGEKLMTWETEISSYYTSIAMNSGYQLKDFDDDDAIKMGISEQEMEIVKNLLREDVSEMPEEHSSTFMAGMQRFEEDTGIDPGYVSGLKLMFGPDLKTIQSDNTYRRIMECLELSAPVFSGMKWELIVFYILTLLMAVFIPISFGVRLPRIVPLSCATGYGVVAAILMFLVRGSYSPIPEPIWKSMLTPITIFMLIAAFAVIGVGVAGIVLSVVVKNGKVAAQGAPMFGGNGGQAVPPVFGADGVAETQAAGPGEVTGYDPYTGEPIYAKPEPPVMQEPETPMADGGEITGYDPYTGEPIYAKPESPVMQEPETPVADGGEITGYDPYTGEPIYGTAEPAAGPGEITGYDPYTGEPIYGTAEPAAAEPAAGPGEITGYDPYTGEPIYGNSEPELTPPPMPKPPVMTEEEPELTPPPMPEPPTMTETEPEPEPEPEAEAQEEEPVDDTPMTEVWIEDPEKGQERKPTAEQRMGTVMAIAGVANGEGFRLPETNVITIGADAKKASWVIKDRLVSGEHCQIRYRAATNLYIVTDLSRNGTFVGDRRLEKGEPAELSAGTVISLADGSNQIRLG